MNFALSENEKCQSIEENLDDLCLPKETVVHFPHLFMNGNVLSCLDF